MRKQIGEYRIWALLRMNDAIYSLEQWREKQTKYKDCQRIKYTGDKFLITHYDCEFDYFSL